MVVKPAETHWKCESFEKTRRPSRAQTILRARFRAAECPGRLGEEKNEEGEEGDEGEEGEEGEEKNKNEEGEEGELLDPRRAPARPQNAVNSSTLWEQTAGSPPRTSQASECSEHLDPMKANCWISAAH